MPARIIEEVLGAAPDTLQPTTAHHGAVNMADDDVVISGISGRLPESRNLREFRQNLLDGVDMVTENDRRWKPGQSCIGLFVCVFVWTS